jgi:hypothetical protein
MELTDEQKSTFYEDGFVKLPGIVPNELINEALRAINSSLGTRGLAPDQLVKFRTLSYCPEITDALPIMNLLYKTPLWNLAETMIGDGQVQPVRASQIALRFPTMNPPREPGAHLDGVFPSQDNSSEGVIKTFTGIFGVFLSHIPNYFMGNFTVWPNTHLLFEDYFRRHGPQSLLKGLPPVAMPQPLQITARTGDVVLCHYQLAHGIAGNSSPFIRYAVFFRLSHIHHEAVYLECMTDIWREWEGMRETVQSKTNIQ